MTVWRERCSTCGSHELSEIIDLGMHPMADTFVPATHRYEADRVYPLICDLCPKCAQVQLRAVTDPDERYLRFDYSYTSSNSAFSRNHWTRYAEDVAASCNLASGARIVEIGSNDGFLSERFLSHGFRVLGVDPSPAMCELAAGRGVETRNALFSHDLARELAAQPGDRPMLIAANNVVNHANDPLDFARGIQALLAEEGTFVFELPYFLSTIVEGKFDQIYHEHVSYFTVTFARNLFKAVGMSVIHAEVVDYHGGSIRVFVRHAGGEDGTVAALIASEEAGGLFDLQTYGAFMARVRNQRDRFMRQVLDLRIAGERLVCVGAAAKANTFLNYYNLDASIVDWVTDASPAKIGKYTPRTRIPIAGDDVVSGCGRLHAIITSWNLADTLRARLRLLNPEIQFLNPYEAD